MDESVQKNLKPELGDVSRLLLKAADLIEEHGWCQVSAVDERGRICMLQAMGRAEVELFGPDGSRSVSLVSDEKIADAVGWPIYRWNDAAGRTQEEVVAKLRAVALGG